MTTMKLNEVKTSVFGRIISVLVIISFVTSIGPTSLWAQEAVLPIDQQNQETPIKPAAEETSVPTSDAPTVQSTTQALAEADSTPLSSPTKEEITGDQSLPVEPTPPQEPEPSQGIKMPSGTYLLTNGHKFVYSTQANIGTDTAPDGTQTSFVDILFLPSCVTSADPSCVNSQSDIKLEDGQQVIGVNEVWETSGCESKLVSRTYIVGTQTVVKAIRVQVINDLIQNYGFTAQDLDALIKKGLIKIAVEDPKSMKAVVKISPDVVLPADAVLSIDPLGNQKLPGQISYQLKQSALQPAIACWADLSGGVWCPPPILAIDSAQATVDSFTYDISYGFTSVPGPILYFDGFGENRISLVKVYYKDPLKMYPMICTIEEGCPSIKGDLMKEIRYLSSGGVIYDEDQQLVDLNGDGNVDALDAAISDSLRSGAERVALIHYLRPVDGVTDRLVKIGLEGRAAWSDEKVSFLDGKARIVEVDDFNSLRLVAINTFRYMAAITVYNLLCVEGAVCIPPPATYSYSLWEIDRKGTDGKALSQTQVFLWNKTAIVHVEGSQEKAEVRFTNLEDLLAQVRKLEMGITQPNPTSLSQEAIQAIADYLHVPASEIVDLEFNLHADEMHCMGTGCALWSGDLKVTTKDEDGMKRFFEGTISQIFDVKPEDTYRINLTEVKRIIEVRGDHFVTTIEFDKDGRLVSAKRVYDDGTVEIYGNLTSRGDAYPVGGFRDKHAVNLWTGGDGMASIWGDLMEVDHPDGTKTLHSYGENFDFVMTVELDKDGNPISAERVYDDGTRIEIYGDLFVREEGSNVRLAAPPPDAVKLAEHGLISYWGILQKTIFYLQNGHKFVYDPQNKSGTDIAPDGNQTSYEDVWIALTKQTTCAPEDGPCSILVSQIAMMEDVVFIGDYETKEILPDGSQRTSDYSIFGIPTLVKTIKVQVKNDLIANYGLSAAALDAWLASGQIKIKVDTKSLIASVFIGEGVTLPADAILYIDPLGERKLPGQITYQLKPGPQPLRPCFADLETGVVSCPPPNFVIESARAVRGNYTYEISYGGKGTYPPVMYADGFSDGRISSVEVYYKDPAKAYPMVCTTEGCPSVLGDLVKEIQYSYGDTEITAEIHYIHPDKPAPDWISSRTVKIALNGQAAWSDQTIGFLDGKNRIVEVDDFDVVGHRVVNQFRYMAYVTAASLAMVYCPDVEGAVCTIPPATFGYVLWQIDRSDAEGNALSHITLQAPGSATVVVENVEEKFQIQYTDLEDLLAQVKKLEILNSLRAVEVLIKKDLMTNFGFDEKTLNSLIKQGLIKIKGVGSSRVDMRTVEVTIDPSIQAADVAFLSDPLGSHKLPGSIQYQLNMTIPDVDCAVEGGCLAEPMYFLASAHFNVGNIFYDLSYLRYLNLVYSVKVYQGDPRIVCITTPCPTGQLVKDIRYIYSTMARKVLAGTAGNYVGSAPIFAIVRYTNPAEGAIINQLIKLDIRSNEGLDFLDKKFRVVQVTESDAAGNKVISKFKYLGVLSGTNPVTCPPGENCLAYVPPVEHSYSYQLYLIERVDAGGRALSRITLQGPESAAVFVEASQKEVAVKFSDFSDLFNQARRLEMYARVIRDLETHIRNHPSTKLLSDGRYNPNLDLNDDGAVNSTDQIMMRNIANASSEVYNRIVQKIMAEVYAHFSIQGSADGTVPPKGFYVAELDVNRDGKIDAYDAAMIKAALFWTLPLKLEAVPEPLNPQPVMTTVSKVS